MDRDRKRESDFGKKPKRMRERRERENREIRRREQETMHKPRPAQVFCEWLAAGPLLQRSPVRSTSNVTCHMGPPQLGIPAPYGGGPKQGPRGHQVTLAKKNKK